MKKRIIAALTALVMVVTMIPASAFAADKTLSVAEANQLIYKAAGLTGEADQGINVAYTTEALAAIDAAQRAVDKFGPGEKEDLEINKLNAAISMYNQYLNAIRMYNVAMSKLTAGSITTDKAGQNLLSAKGKVVEDIIATYGGLDLKAITGKGYDLSKPVTPLTGLSDVSSVSGDKLDATFDTDLKSVVAGKVVDIESADLSTSLKDKLVYEKTPEDSVVNSVAFKNADVAPLVDNMGVAKVVFGSNVEATYSEALTFFGNLKNVNVDSVKDMTVANYTEKDPLKDYRTKDICKYAYLSANYGVVAQAIEKYDAIAASVKTITDATKALSEVKYEGKVIDVTTAYGGNGATHAVVNKETYAVVKAAYDAAKKAHDDFEVEHKKLDTTSGDNAALKTKYEKLAKYDKSGKAVSGTLVACEKAMANAELIETLYAKKDSLTFDDYVAFKSADFTDVAKIDAFLSNNDIVVGKQAVKGKYDKVLTAMNAFGANIAKNDYGKYYGDKIKAAIDKIPALSTMKLSDKAVVEAAVNEINAFQKFMSDNNINTNKSADFPLALSDTFGVAIKGGTAFDVDAFYNTDFSELKASTLTLDDLNRLVSAGKIVMGSGTISDANYLAVKYMLTNVAELFGKFDANDEATVEAYEKAVYTVADGTTVKGIKNVNKAYDEAYAKLTDAEKKAIASEFNTPSKTALKTVAKSKNLIKNFEGIKDAVVVEKATKAKAAIEKMIKATDAGIIIKDIYSVNKPLLDEVAGYFADDVVKYVYENATTDDDFAGSTKAYNVADVDGKDATLTKYKQVVAEYEAYEMQQPDKDAKAVETMIAALKAFPEKNVTFADVDDRAAAFDAAKAAFDKLSKNQQLKVTNASVLPAYEGTIKQELVKCIEGEMVKLIAIYNEKLDANQVAIVESVDGLLAKYAARLGDSYVADADIYSAGSTFTAMFKAPFTQTANSGADLYVHAKVVMKNSVKTDAVDEIIKVYDTIKAGTNFVGDAKNEIKDYADAKVVLDAINAYNSLSAEAKALFVTSEFGTLTTGKLSPAGAKMVAANEQELKVLVNSENKAKSFFLANATVEAIADQQLPEDGSAVTPAVVVKDAMGNVIDAKNYKVEYANNTVAGTAKVIIDAVGTVYTGRVEATFNIVADAATVKPEKVTVKTDQGIIKVTANKVEGLSYRFMVKQEGAKNWKTINTKSNVATFTGLVKNARYEVKVATVLGKEVSEFNNAGFVYTNKLGNKSAMMYKAAINKVTINKGVAKITAKNVAYKGEKYRVGYKKYGTKNFKWNVWGTNTVKTVKGLKKGVKYTFTIQYRYVSEVSGTYVYSKYSKYVVKKAK